MLKQLFLRNRFADQSQILCGASLGRGNNILFTASGSHDQDGRHAHIWSKPFKNLLLQNRGGGPIFKDIHHHLRPVIDLNVRLVILGDFNIQIDCINTEFVKFMETSFRCRQQIKQSTTDSGSILDLIFSNCEAFCDVVEAYWTDHKLVYCAIDQ